MKWIGTIEYCNSTVYIKMEILNIIAVTMNFILIIAKQLAVTINKNNTTAVSAASKPHIIRKWNYILFYLYLYSIHRFELVQLDTQWT